MTSLSPCLLGCNNSKKIGVLNERSSALRLMTFHRQVSADVWRLGWVTPMNRGRGGQRTHVDGPPGAADRPRRDRVPAIRQGVVTERRPVRHAPDLFRPTGRNLRTVHSPGSVPVSLVTPLIGIKRKSIDLVIDENWLPVVRSVPHYPVSTPISHSLVRLCWPALTALAKSTINPLWASRGNSCIHHHYNAPIISENKDQL